MSRVLPISSIEIHGTESLAGKGSISRNVFVSAHSGKLEKHSGVIVSQMIEHEPRSEKR